MFKRICVVKFTDSFGVEHAAKVEAESLSGHVFAITNNIDGTRSQTFSYE